MNLEKSTYNRRSRGQKIRRLFRDIKSGAIKALAYSVARWIFDHVRKFIAEN